MTADDKTLTEQIAGALAEVDGYGPTDMHVDWVMRYYGDFAAAVLPIIRKAERDAAREALKRLRRHELAIIPTDADPNGSTCVRQQALAWRIDCLIRNDYPEETP